MAQLLEFTNNHALLVGSTVIMLIAVLVYELRLKAQNIGALDAAVAIREINKGAKVLDIREADRFTAGHIINALNVTPDQIVAEASKKLKKKRPVVLVCDTGAVSARAAAELRKAGYELAFSLRGGMSAWQRDNHPVVASDRPGG